MIPSSSCPPSRQLDRSGPADDHDGLVALTPLPGTRSFFDVVNNPGNAHYHEPGYLLTLFSPEGGGFPLVAITEHGQPQGPAFRGVRQVTKLFARLFQAFPDLSMPTLDPKNPLYLKSDDGGTIAVQTNVKGTHQDWWFPQSDPDHFYSKPLSDITPANKPVTVPACPVFTFNAQHKINQLAIYMDRYHFVAELAPTLSFNFTTDVEHALRVSKLLKDETKREPR
jgi:hypothetical protein